MSIRNFFIALACVFLLPVCMISQAFASSYKLEGSYYAAGQKDIDGGIPAGKDILYVTLEGSSAKSVYSLIDAEPEKVDLVDEEVGLVKRKGNIECTRVLGNYQRYYCGFGLDLTDGKSIRHDLRH